MALHLIKFIRKIVQWPVEVSNIAIMKVITIPANIEKDEVKPFPISLDEPAVKETTPKFLAYDKFVALKVSSVPLPNAVMSLKMSDRIPDTSSDEEDLEDLDIDVVME